MGQDISDNALAASIDYIATNILQVGLAVRNGGPTCVTLTTNGGIYLFVLRKLLDQMLLEVSDEEFEAALSHF